MLTTLLRPTAGRATVAGADLLGDPVGVRRRIGYVPQAIGATGGGSDPNATVGEEIALQAQLYRVPRAQAAQRGAVLMRQLELAGLEGRLVKTLSGGQRRRLDIALGLVHSPRLVFLDEPTTGLDPQSRSNLWEHIRGLRGELGSTVFLTTHYLDEADALCDRILVIDYGRIVAAGTPEELKRRISGDVITLTVRGDPDAARSLLAEHPGVREIVLDGRSLRLAVEQGEEALPGLLRTLMLLSGIMLPMALGPSWLRHVSRATPFGYIINAMREAYTGHYFNNLMVEGIGVSIGLAVVRLWLAGRVFVRENA